jgi:DNA polymerase sigma
MIDDIKRELDILVRSALAGRQCIIDLKVFGSRANKLALEDSSDVDITLLDTGLLGEESELLDAIAKEAQKPENKKQFPIVISFAHAAQPVLKFKVNIGGRQVDVDFSINNYLGYYNTHLLDNYCQIHPVVSALIKRVKEWAHTNDLVGNMAGFINTYAYSLLVIAFLQQRKIIPNLQWIATERSHNFPVEQMSKKERKKYHIYFASYDCPEVQQIRLNSRGGLKADDFADILFDMFLNLCLQKLKWKECKISINPQFLGTSSRPEQAGIEIIDPFNIEHNLAAQVTEESLNALLAVIKVSVDIPVINETACNS